MKSHAPVQPVVDVLRRALERAEAGEINAVAIVFAGPDLEPDGEFNEGDGNLVELLGAVRLVGDAMSDEIRFPSAEGDAPAAVTHLRAVPTN